ncbi:SRPBCC family protein [Parahaliea mediterranea]|uniref:SRPBCC family protein n=1 Tax=Parahaliea mediterranea TaxID=651086 RepID=A0A939DEA4_9GAMM|nr:SRPBCC family protein [Parahaliea mediterranea]MBN7796479.1 SRPBCC family protein [Parahaliea mediterranea]
MKIAIETQVVAPLNTVWAAWTAPADITAWNFATAQWRCPRADIDLRTGGRFNYRMEARDGSMGFDFEGEFTEIQPQALIRFKLGDDREVSVEFIDTADGVRVIETFDAEDEHSAEQQRQGWLAILNNFKQHVEARG